MIHVRFERNVSGSKRIVNAEMSDCGLFCATSCRKYVTTSGGPYCNEFDFFQHYIGKKIQAWIECQVAARRLEVERERRITKLMNSNEPK